MMLEDSVIGKMLNHMWEMDESGIQKASKKTAWEYQIQKELVSMDEAMAAMLAGNVVLFVDYFDKAIKIGSKGYPEQV